MELLLAVFLLALFLGALAFSFGKLQPQGHLQEGRDRFESLLRMAKAHAVYSGRKLQIQFIPDDSNPLKAHWHLIDLAWEPDPYANPGIYLPLSLPGWDMAELNNHIAVEEVTNPFDPVISRGSESEETSEALQPLTFSPDGSVESASILLASRDEEDARKVWVHLSGLTGSLSHELVEPSSETELPEEDPSAVVP